jgi:hypothetical protein
MPVVMWQTGAAHVQWTRALFGRGKKVHENRRRTITQIARFTTYRESMPLTFIFVIVFSPLTDGTRSSSGVKE